MKNFLKSRGIEKNSKCSPLKFINELKNELKYEVGIINDKIMSKILDKRPRYIENKKSQIKKHIKWLQKNPGKQNIFSIEELNSFINVLKKKPENNYQNLVKIVEDFKNNNKFISFNQKVKKYHPNLNLNYFEHIDTNISSFWESSFVLHIYKFNSFYFRKKKDNKLIILFF